MNNSLFLKAFKEIKKQVTQKPEFKPKLQRTTALPLPSSSNNSQKPLEKQQPLPISKRISKDLDHDRKNHKIAKIRNDRFLKLYSSQNKQLKEKDEALKRTIFIERSPGYSQLLSILKEFRIYIETVNEYKVVFNDQEQMEAAYQVLLRNQCQPRKPNQQKQSAKSIEEPKSKIFNRLK